MPRSFKLLSAFILCTTILCTCKEERFSYRVGQVTVGDCAIQVEIADTPELKKQGLSNRKSLSSDWGMLFVFEKKGRYSFWMKDMQFPLDFIWIANGKVSQITRNVPVAIEDKPVTYMPLKPVDYMLEVNAGTADKCGIKIGDMVRL